MNHFFEFLYSILPALNVISVIALLLKSVIVFRRKGFNLPEYMISFFRIYTGSEREMTHSTSRLRYMRINNLINFYIYLWIMITLIIFIVFRKFY